MLCPKCKRLLPEKVNIKINFCPLCGERLYEAGRKYLIQVQSNISRDSDGKMMMFLDDRDMYDIKALDTVCIAVEAGFHTLNFRYKIRNKKITILVASNYMIGANYNTLSGLIETNIMKVDETEDGLSEKDLNHMELSSPVMVSDDGIKSFDAITGHDTPEFELSVTSGLKGGILRIYTNRMEFVAERDYKKDLTQFADIVCVRPKMGSIDIQCEGNVHKVYSIPKDNYNEVLAFLNNRIGDGE